MSAPLPRLTQIPAGIATAADWEALARDRVDAATWAWLDGGAGDGRTRRDNRAAFARRRLLPRVLADVAGGDTALDLFGQACAHPFLLAPVAHQTLLHPEGELASARAAAALDGGMVASTLSGMPLERIAAAAGRPPWFQLYFQPTPAATLALVRRAEAAGCPVLVVTVDVPVNAGRDDEVRAGFVLPPGAAANLADAPAPAAVARAGGTGVLGSALLRAAPRWRDLAWLRAQTTLPLLIKGVLAADDALRALEHGVDGVVVSNHGGRSLDGVPAALDALPAVVAAVAGRVPVLLDGGIRRGSDALVARALGADAVLVGRAAMHGLAAAGAPGVAHVLHLLRTELETAMALCGCRTWAGIGAAVLAPAPAAGG